MGIEEVLKRVDELESRIIQQEGISNQLIRAHGALQQKVMILEGFMSSQPFTDKDGKQEDVQ